MQEHLKSRRRWRWWCRWSSTEYVMIEWCLEISSGEWEIVQSSLLSFCLSSCLPVDLFDCLSFCLSIFLSVSVSVCVCMCVCVCVCVCMSFYLSISRRSSSIFIFVNQCIYSSLSENTLLRIFCHLLSPFSPIQSASICCTLSSSLGHISLGVSSKWTRGENR